jgi:hypothetical protein
VGLTCADADPRNAVIEHLCKVTGYHELAWVAAECSFAAVRRSGGPAVRGLNTDRRGERLPRRYMRIRSPAK